MMMTPPFDDDETIAFPEAEHQPVGTVTQQRTIPSNAAPVGNGTFAKILLGLVGLSVIVGLLMPLLQPVQSRGDGASTTSGKTDTEQLKAVKTSLQALKEDRLALIHLNGAIDSSGGEGGLFSEEAMAQTVRKALDAAAEDDKIRGVLLVVNSPGGTVGMSQELSNAVKRLKAVKPVVVSVTDLCASGGYYTAVAADKIIVNEGSLIGSIGVIIHATNMKRLLSDKLGIDDMTIKSGKYKDILSQSRPMRDDERAMLQELVNESYQVFLKTVLDGRLDKVSADKRPALEARLRAVADGRVTTGTQAVNIGLADAVGDWHKAKEVLNTLAIERFKLSENTQLELEPFSNSKDALLDMLGLSSASTAAMPSPAGLGLLGRLIGVLQQPRTANTLQADVSAPTATLLPAPATFIQHHQNQPLWFYQ
jgi:protease-4